MRLTQRLKSKTGRAFLLKNCTKCHGAKLQEGKVRLDKLAAPTQKNLEIWSSVADMVESGEMPPYGEKQPDADSKAKFLKWISQELKRLAKPSPSMRRLNRTEYEYTLHDLLGIDTPLSSYLPEDGKVQGFDNVASGLGISSILLERYLEAADVAFESSIRRIKPLPPKTRRAVLMDAKENIGSVKGNKGGVIESEGAFVDFTPGWPPARIDAAHPIEGGIYRCRIAVWPHDPGEHRTLSVAVFSGPLFGPGKRKFNGMFDVTGTPEKPRIIEFTTRLAEGHSLHILPWVYPEHVTWRDKHEKRPGVAIKWAETHGPLDHSFPSPSQIKLFGKSKTISMKEGWPVYMRHRRGVKSHFVESTDPKADIERIIGEFVPRAFRRPVDSQLKQQFIDFAIMQLNDGNSFEESVRAGVTAVLSSPHFLLLNNRDTADNYTLASRLSYFLWSSMPDEELRQLAAKGQLRDPKVRFEQVERNVG